MSTECVICGRPMVDQAYADTPCAAEAAQKLRMIVELGPEARNVAYGLTRGAEGAASGKPGSRSPGNDDALDALGEVQGTLTTWVRHVAEERGGPMEHAGDDPIVHSARYLLANLEWMRHRAEVDIAFDEIAQCARRLQGLIDGPRAKKYLGPCGAAIGIECKVCQATDLDHHRDCDVTCPHKFVPAATCEGDVYGPAGGKTGRCRTCGAEVDQGERKAWLDEQVRDKAFRAAHIADAYGLNVKTIRAWAERGHLHEHGKDRQQRPLYLVGEVLDLARAAALRRAENEAHRARRTNERLSA